MAARGCRWLWLVPAVLAGLAHAAGPARVATGNRQLWPTPVNTVAEFDQASRAALVVYRQTLQGWAGQSDAQLQELVHTRSLNRASVDQWLQRELAEVQDNWQQAAADCRQAKPDDWSCDPAWVTAPATRLPPALADWYRDMQDYSRTYQLEQLRLAALFPKTSSEIARFTPQEKTGSELPDRQFLLSFDDGPSAAGGHSEQTLAMLRQQQKSLGTLQANMRKIQALHDKIDAVLAKVDQQNVGYILTQKKTLKELKKLADSALGNGKEPLFAKLYAVEQDYIRTIDDLMHHAQILKRAGQGSVTPEVLTNMEKSLADAGTLE